MKKCTLRWYGPFEVVSEREGRNYWIQTRNKTRRIHESRLKKVVLGSRDPKVRSEAAEVVQEFEDALDKGAAAGPGWQALYLNGFRTICVFQIAVIYYLLLLSISNS